MIEMFAVWQMEAVDEGTQLGLFTTPQVAMKHYDATYEVPTVWCEWPSGDWKGSIDGEVEVTITKVWVLDK